MVSYERIYEGLNIATEMINGEKRDYTHWSTMKKIASTAKDQLGHVYVKYLDPINLDQYVRNSCKGIINSGNVETLALQLTEDLMEKQTKAAPVTLNSIISACLLQENNPSMQMSSLLEKAGMIYDYLKEKPWLTTFMTTKPMKNLAQLHVKGLGFKLNKVTKKDAQILLSYKEDDLRVKLILSHYSMQLMPALLIEGCLSIFLRNAVLTDEAYYEGKDIQMLPLFDIIKLYADLFRNEHFVAHDLSKNRLLQRVNYFDRKGFLRVNGDVVQVANKERTLSML